MILLQEDVILTLDAQLKIYLFFKLSLSIQSCFKLVLFLSAGKKCFLHAGQMAFGEHTIYQRVQLTYGIIFLMLSVSLMYIYIYVMPHTFNAY